MSSLPPLDLGQEARRATTSGPLASLRGALDTRVSLRQMAGDPLTSPPPLSDQFATSKARVSFQVPTSCGPLSPSVDLLLPRAIWRCVSTDTHTVLMPSYCPVACSHQSAPRNQKQGCTCCWGGLLLLPPPPLQEPLHSSPSAYFLVEKETDSLKQPASSLAPPTLASVSSLVGGGGRGQPPHWAAGLMAPSVQLSQPLRCLGLEKVVWGVRTGEIWNTFGGRLGQEEKRGSCSMRSGCPSFWWFPCP